VFITFEGPEGAGKTTQSGRLAAALRDLGHRVTDVREPGGTPVGDQIRGIVLGAEPARRLGARTEILLFSAARAQLVDEVIGPALHRGEIVICDRYSDSTVAYQAGGRGLPGDAVRQLVEFATDGLRPDVTFLLDLDVTTGLARKTGLAADRIEQEDWRFHQRVRDGYLALAAAEPERVVVVEASRPANELAVAILARVQSRLPEQTPQLVRDAG
jgi:dTMP kinase